MFSLKNEEKYIKKTFILIQLIFMCVTLFTIFKYGNSLLLGSLEKFDNDDVRYIRSAWTLINKKIISYHNINESTVYIMPGLTFTLSFFTLLFGKFGGITAFKIFQLILQMTSIYLIFLIGRKVFNSKVAIIACILDALYICEIYTANLILMECSFKFLLLLLIYISIYAVETKSIKLYILGGIIWALACLFRPTVGAYPIVILIMWIKNKYNFKDIIKFTLIVSTVFCLILSPWWIRNYKVFNMFIPFTKSTGNPFLQGTYVHNNAVNPTPYKIVDDLIEQDTIEINTGIYRLKTYVTKKPLLYLYWYTIGKTLFLWAVPFYWKNYTFHSLYCCYNLSLDNINYRWYRHY